MVIMKVQVVFLCAVIAAEATTLQLYAPPTSNQRQLSPSSDKASSMVSGFEESTSSGHVETVASQHTSSNVAAESFSELSGQTTIESTHQFSDQPIHVPSFVEPSQPSSQVSLSLSGDEQELFSQQSLGSGKSEEDCSEGQLRHSDGTCVTPEITRNVFLYKAPQRELRNNVDLAELPMPKVEHNIVFIRTDELQSANDPIVVPPPQRKHIIYVLNKESQFGGNRIIEITTPPPKTPEVYFVNYAEGDKPNLPDGIDFETALNSAVHDEGRLITGTDSIDSAHRDELHLVTGVDSNLASGNVLVLDDDSDFVPEGTVVISDDSDIVSEDAITMNDEMNFVSGDISAINGDSNFVVSGSTRGDGVNTGFISVSGPEADIKSDISNVHEYSDVSSGNTAGVEVEAPQVLYVTP